MTLIRPLAATDSIEAITALLHRAYSRLGAMGLNYTAVDQSSEITRKRFDGGQGFVAVSKGALVGTIVVQPAKADSPCEYFRRQGIASIHQFAVEPAIQSTGIGRELITACETWTVKRGLEEIALDTAEQATHLIAFYERLGFEACGFVQWQGKVYRSVVMRKKLI